MCQKTYIYRCFAGTVPDTHRGVRVEGTECTTCWIEGWTGPTDTLCMAGNWTMSDYARNQTPVVWPISSCSVGLASMASEECYL
jgi:hypothetical protein